MPVESDLADCALERWKYGASGAKAHWRGTHRAASLNQSLARVREVATLAGITRVANVTGLDVIGLPVVAVYRPNARSLVVAQGKGLDQVAATISGMMEAIETHCAERPRLPLRLASTAELSSEQRLATVERLPRVLGRSLPAERAVLWTEGVDLVDDRARWVPYELVHTNFTVPLPAGSGFFPMSSNGLAAGNHPLEAMSHALCELVERDAMALFNEAGAFAIDRLRIDPTTVTDPDCRHVLELIDAAHLAVGLWDITSDIGITACVAVIVDREDSAFRQRYYATGSGCHPAREVALLRALTEAAQCRLTYIAGARDDADRQFFDRARNRERVNAMLRMVERPSKERRQFNDLPSRSGDDFEADVAWELERLSHAGMNEVIAVDLTLPEIGIPVVRVIVPGLESLSSAPGYTPGPRAHAAARAQQVAR